MDDRFARDPTEFLAAIKATGGKWTAMNAARLVMGRVADRIRESMGDHWLTVAIAAHLAAYPDHRSFAHATLRAWLDYQAGRLDDAEYHARLIELAAEGKREFLRVH